MHGVFREVPLSSLPPFLQSVQFDSLGFKGPFLEKESLFYVRAFDYLLEEKVSLENYYPELFSLTQNLLMSEKIRDLINKESKNLYIEKVY